MTYIPYLSTVVTFAFVIAVYTRYRQRGGVHLLLWAVGLLFYGIGTLSEFEDLVPHRSDVDRGLVGSGNCALAYSERQRRQSDHMGAGGCVSSCPFPGSFRAVFEWKLCACPTRF